MRPTVRSLAALIFIDRVTYLTLLLVTRFVEAYESKEHLYVVMDLYGSDLLEQVSNAQFFSEQDGKKIIQSLANAIKYLHGRKIVHADVRVRLVDVPSHVENLRFFLARESPLRQ